MNTIRHPERNPAIRSVITSVFALLAAAALALGMLVASRSRSLEAARPVDVTSRVTADVAAALPDDPALANRLVSRWTNVAAAIARSEGAAGLRALDLFGEDAADLFSRNPGYFRELTALLSLDEPLREASVGPWRETVLQWARNGRLGPYREHLDRLDSRQRELLAKTPACLPLLGREASTAETMLSRYGARAWRLFLVVDFADDVAGVERVASALAIHGERMLGVNESHGPALALMFVPPKKDVSVRLPRLFDEAIKQLGIDDAGALFLANYDDLMRLVLVEGRTPEEIAGAIVVLAGQPEEVRALASDSGRALRLLLERRRGDPIGADVLARCGPEAADLLFEKGGYGNHPQEKDAAMAILSHRGWPGLELLRRFRDVEAWHRLIRRADLMDRDEPPLIVRLAFKLELERSPDRQGEIERYLTMPRDQIVGLEVPPTIVDKALDWLPGYVAVHTAYDAARGYRVETSEIAFALMDGVSTVTLVGKLAGQAVKTVGRQVAKAEIEVATRAVREQAMVQLAKNERREAATTLLSRLPGALTSVTRSLPAHLPTLDVTAVVRSASAVAKKVGVRTWGKLDRRIIMRGDRKVIIDLFNKQVVTLVGKEARDTAIKGTVAKWAENGLSGLTVCCLGGEAVP